MWEAVWTLDLQVLRQSGSAAARRIRAAFTHPITRYLTTPRIPGLGSFERCALGVFPICEGGALVRSLSNSADALSGVMPRKTCLGAKDV
jgi:hypothetical protein